MRRKPVSKQKVSRQITVSAKLALEALNKNPQQDAVRSLALLEADLRRLDSPCATHVHEYKRIAGTHGAAAAYKAIQLAAGIQPALR